jgi:hypothetical protein
MVNSGVCVFLATYVPIYIHAYYRHGKTDVHAMSRISAVLILVATPAFITHIIPATIIYIPFFIILAIVLAFVWFPSSVIILALTFCVAPCFRPCCSNNQFIDTVKGILIRSAWMVAFMFILQGVFNWSLVFYGGGGYLTALQYDFAESTSGGVRGVNCYFNGISEESQQSVAFASLF